MATPVPTQSIATPGYEESKYYGAALAQLNILKQQMQLGRLHIGKRRVELEKGVWCICNICYGLEEVYIYAASSSTTTKVHTRLLLNTTTDRPIKTLTNNIYAWSYPGSASWTRVKDIDIAVELSRQDPRVNSYGTQTWQNPETGDCLTWGWNGHRYLPDRARSNLVYLNYSQKFVCPGRVLGAGLRITNEGDKILLVAVENGGLYKFINNGWQKIGTITFETNPVVFTYTGNKCAYVYVYDGKKRYARSETEDAAFKSELIWLELDNTADTYVRNSKMFYNTRVCSYTGPTGEYVPGYVSYYYMDDIFTLKHYENYGDTRAIGYSQVSTGGTWVSGLAIVTAIDATADLLVLAAINGGSSHNEGILTYYFENGETGSMRSSTSDSYAFSGRVLTVLPISSIDNLIGRNNATLRNTLHVAALRSDRYGEIFKCSIPLLFDLRTKTTWFSTFESNYPDTGGPAPWDRSIKLHGAVCYSATNSLDTSTTFSDYTDFDLLRVPDIRYSLPAYYFLETAADGCVILGKTPKETYIFSTLTCADGKYKSMLVNDNNEDLDATDLLQIKAQYFKSGGFFRGVLPSNTITEA